MPGKNNKPQIAPSFFGSPIGGLKPAPADKKSIFPEPVSSSRTPESLQKTKSQPVDGKVVKLPATKKYADMNRKIYGGYADIFNTDPKVDNNATLSRAAAQEAQAKKAYSQQDLGVLGTYNANRARQAKLEDLVRTGNSSNGADLDEIMYKFDMANFGRPTYGKVAGLTADQVRKRSTFRAMAAGKVQDARTMTPEQLRAKDLGLTDELSPDKNAYGRRQLRQDLESAGLGLNKYDYTSTSPIWENDQQIALGLAPHDPDYVMGVGKTDWSNTTTGDSDLMTFLHTAGQYNPVTGLGNLAMYNDRTDSELSDSDLFAREAINIAGSILTPMGASALAGKLAAGGATAAAGALESQIANAGLRAAPTVFQAAASKAGSIAMNAVGHAVMANAPDIAYQASKVGLGKVAEETAKGFARGINPFSEAKPHERLGAVATLLGACLTGLHVYGKAKYKVAEYKYNKAMDKLGLSAAKSIADTVAEARANPHAIAKIVADGKNFTKAEVAALDKFRESIENALEKVRPGDENNALDADLISRVTIARYKKTKFSGMKNAPTLEKALPDDAWHGVTTPEEWENYVNVAKGKGKALASEQAGQPAEDPGDTVPTGDYEKAKELLVGLPGKDDVPVRSDTPLATNSGSGIVDELEAAANAAELGTPTPNFKESGKYDTSRTKFEDISRSADGVYQPGSNKIALFEGADINTAIHEDAHRWLDIMPKDFQRAWTSLIANKDGKLTAEDIRKAHEAWAVFTESYLKNGQLPKNTPGFVADAVEALANRMRAPRENTTGTRAIDASGVTEKQFGDLAFPARAKRGKHAAPSAPEPAPTPVDELRPSIGLDDAKRGKQWVTVGKNKKNLTFESDVDEASYIATRTRTSKKLKAEMVKFVADKTGMSEEDVLAHGERVNAAVEDSASKRRGIKVNVKQVGGELSPETPVDVPQSVPVQEPAAPSAKPRLTAKKTDAVVEDIPAEPKPRLTAKRKFEQQPELPMQGTDFRDVAVKKFLQGSGIDEDLTELLESTRGKKPDETSSPKEFSLGAVAHAGVANMIKSGDGLATVAMRLAQKTNYSIAEISDQMRKVIASNDKLIRDSYKGAGVTDSAARPSYTSEEKFMSPEEWQDRLDASMNEAIAAQDAKIAAWKKKKSDSKKAAKENRPTEVASAPDGELDWTTQTPEDLKRNYGVPSTMPQKRDGEDLSYLYNKETPDQSYEKGEPTWQDKTVVDFAKQTAAEQERIINEQYAKNQESGKRAAESTDRNLERSDLPNIVTDADLQDMSSKDFSHAKALKDVIRDHLVSMKHRGSIDEFLSNAVRAFEDVSHRTPFIDVVHNLAKYGADSSVLSKYAKAYSDIYGKTIAREMANAADVVANKSIGIKQRNLVYELTKSPEFASYNKDLNLVRKKADLLGKLVRNIASGDAAKIQSALDELSFDPDRFGVRVRDAAISLADSARQHGLDVSYDFGQPLLTPHDELNIRTARMSNVAKQTFKDVFNKGLVAVNHETGTIEMSPKLIKMAMDSVERGEYDSPNVTVFNTIKEVNDYMEAQSGRPFSADQDVTNAQLEQVRAATGLDDLMNKINHPGMMDDVEPSLDDLKSIEAEFDNGGPLESTRGFYNSKPTNQPASPESFIRSKMRAIKDALGSSTFDGLRTIMDAVNRSGAGDVAETMGRIQYDSESLFGTSRRMMMNYLSKAFPSAEKETVRAVFDSGMRKAAAGLWDELSNDELKAVQAYQRVRSGLRSIAEKQGMLIQRNVDDNMLKNKDMFIGKECAAERPGWSDLPANDKIRTSQWIKGKIKSIENREDKGYVFDQDKTGVDYTDKPSQIVVTIERPDGSTYEHVPEPSPGLNARFKTSTLIEDKNYVPRIYNKEAINALADAKPGDELYNRVVDHMLKNGAAKSVEEAVNLVDKLRSYAHGRLKDPQTRIEHARVVDTLPPEFYSSNYMDDILHDTRRLTADIVWTKEMGDDHQVIRSAAARPEVDSDRLISATNDFMQSIGLFGKSKSQTTWANISSMEGYLQTALNMGANPAASVKQISTFANTAAFFGEKFAAESIYETLARIKDNKNWHDPNSPLARVVESGAVEAPGFGLEEGDRLHMMGVGADEGMQAPQMSKTAKFVTAATKPFEQMDLLTRVSSALASEKWLRSAVEKLRENPSDEFLRGALKRRYRFTDDDITRLIDTGDLLKNDIHRAYHYGADVQIRAKDGHTVRVLQTLPGMRMLFRFKTFDIGQWYNVKRAITEARAGSVGTLARMLGYGAANGYMISNITGLIKDGVANGYEQAVSAITGQPVKSGVSNQNVVKKGLRDVEDRLMEADYMGAGLNFLQVVADSVLSSGVLGTPGAIAQNAVENSRYDSSVNPIAQAFIDYATPASFDKLVTQPNDAIKYGTTMYKGSRQPMLDAATETGVDTDQVDKKSLARQPVSALEAFGRSAARLAGAEIPAVGYLTKNFEPSMTGAFKANLSGDAARAMRNYGVKFRPRRFSQPAVSADGEVREPTIAMQNEMNMATGKKFSEAVDSMKRNGIMDAGGIRIPLLDSPIDIMRRKDAFEAIARTLPGTRDKIGGRKLSELSDSELSYVSKKVVEFYEMLVKRHLESVVADEANTP